MSPPEPFVVVVPVPQDRTTIMTHCASCDAALSQVLVGGSMMPTLRPPRGYVWRDPVWWPTRYHCEQRRRLIDLIASGRGTAADRARLDRLDFGRPSDRGREDHWRDVQHTRAHLTEVYRTGAYDRFRLSARIVCAICDAECLITTSDDGGVRA